MTKVKMDTIKPWISNRITEMLGGMEDDVVVEYVFNQIEADKVSASFLCLVTITITSFQKE